MALNGIDIASYQKNIDLSKVPCDFVIIKATQGTSYVNPDFTRALQQALSLGKKVGVYHYASSGGAKAEAQHFVETAKEAIGKAIFVLDWEQGDNANFKTPSYARTFLETVKAKIGYTPMIYMSKSVCRDYNWTAVAPTYPLWVAQYASNSITGYKSDPWTDKGGYGSWKYPTIFQYASTGRLKNWNGNLDLDIAYLTNGEWDKMAGTTTTTAKATTNTTTTSTNTYVVSKGEMKYTLKDIKYGDKGEDVKFLQQLLTAKGFECTVDGTFGAKTLQALANYDVSIKNIKCGKGTWTQLIK